MPGSKRWRFHAGAFVGFILGIISPCNGITFFDTGAKIESSPHTRKKTIVELFKCTVMAKYELTEVFILNGPVVASM